MMKNLMKQSIIYTAIFMLSPSVSMCATLEERLEKLEGDVALTREEADDSASRFKNNMSVTGYADTEYISTNQTGKKTGFRIHHFSMFLKKQISDDLRFFSEIEYEDGPYYEPAKATGTDPKTVGSGKIFAEAVNFDYQWRADTSVRAGRFFTPAGIWSVDHYPPFVATQERPQHIRNIFPQLVDGAAISGNHPLGDAFVNYDLFVGNGETTLADGSGDSNSTTAVGLRANASLPITQQFDVGATFYRDKLASAADTTQPKKDALGIHAKIRQGAYGFQGEYAKASYKPTNPPGGDYDRTGYYAQLSYDINKWTLGYRYDYYDPKSTVTNDGTKIHSAMVNYRVSKNVVLKWEHHLANAEDTTKDYFRNIASIAVNLD